MKRKLVILIISFFVSLNIYSQGVFFVEDLAHIATSIENGLTMYHQLQNDYEQLKNTVEQIKMMKKNMEGFDWQSYFQDGEWDSFLHAADDFMTMQDNLDRLINQKNMEIGGMRFSLNDLYKTDFFINVLNETEKNLDPRAITEEQSRAFVGRHGMSYDHYMKWLNLEHQIELKTKESVVEREIIFDTAQELSEYLNNLPPDTEITSSQAMEQQNGLKMKISTQANLMQLDILSSLKESLDNFIAMEANDKQLYVYNVEKVTQAEEKFKGTVHGANTVYENDGYLHLYPTQTNSNGGKSYEWKKIINENQKD